MGGNTSHGHSRAPEGTVTFVVSYGTEKTGDNGDGRGPAIRVEKIHDNYLEWAFS